MQQALHPYLDLSTGLSLAFDHFIAGDVTATVQVLHATVAHLPAESPSRDAVSGLLLSLNGPLSDDQEMDALQFLYGLLEGAQNQADRAV